MRTNMISIVDMAPIYPQEPYLKMVQRLQDQVEGLGFESATEALDALFNVGNSDSLVDSEGVITEYELEPAINQDELATLAERLRKALEGHSDLDLRKAKVIVRNTINCVPRSLEDLVDYVEPETVGFINTGFFIESPDMAGEDEERRMSFIDNDVAKVDPGRRDFLLGMAHESLVDQPLESHAGLTNRQRLLERAGVYYTLHRYGQPTASLWLARFLNPFRFCSCPNFDCGARHFGFTDPMSSAVLVLENLPYIESLLHRSNKFAPLCEGMTAEKICENHLSDVLFAAEAFMLIDQERLEATNISKMLDFAGKHLELMDELHQIRFLKVVLTFQDIYNGGYEQINFLKQPSEDILVESIKRFQNYVAANPGRPSLEMLTLWDANNFLAVGQDIGDMSMGVRLHNLFLRTMYEPDAYVEMSEIIIDLVYEYPDLSDFSVRIMQGFLTNYSYVLARQFIATTVYCDAVFQITNEPSVVNLLAEFGYWPAMKMRMTESSNPAEVDYWARRLTTEPA